MTISLDTTIEVLKIMGMLSVRAYNTCRNARINNMHQLMQIGMTDLLKVRNCGRKTLKEIMDIQTKFADIANELPVNDNTELESKKENSIDIVKSKLSCLHPSAQYKLNSWLEWRFNKLSVRAKNCVSNYSDLNVILPIAFSGIEFNFNNVKNCGRKSGAEISVYISDVKHHIEDLTSDIELGIYQPKIDEKEIIISRLEHSFPYLLDKEIMDVAIFYKEKGHLPWLYIIRKYILRHDDVKVDIHRDYYGLNSTGVSLSLSEIAYKQNLSRERVRQIAQKRLLLPSILNDYVSTKLSKLIGNVTSFDDSVWLTIQEDNMLEGSVSQTCRLVCLIIGNYSIIQLGDGCNEYLVKRPLLNNVKPKNALREICRLIEFRHTTIERIDILEIMTSDKKRCYHEDVSDICVIFADYISLHYDCEITNNRYITAMPNRLDVSSAIENILKQHGVPMSSDELWKEFRLLHPNSNILSIKSFRPHILRNLNIKPKGKSGMYVLKEWKHQFTGSLTDYLAYILVTLDEPITLDELAEFAKEQFPNTNKKSVYSLISVDPLNRFVIFENGYIGIAGGHHLEDCGLKERRIVRRYDFDSRFESFKLFVISHKRLPIQSKNYSEEEQSLSRWMTNALSGNINISQAQSNSLHVFLSEYEDVPQNGTEYRFKQMCDRLKVMVSKTFTLPTSDNPSEYIWLHKNLIKYIEYTDNRKQYFEELLIFLKDYGFYF